MFRIRRPARDGVLGACAALGVLALSGCAGPVDARYLGEGPPDGRDAWSLVVPATASGDPLGAQPWDDRRDVALGARDARSALEASAWPEPARPRLGEQRYSVFRRSEGYTYYRRSVTEEYRSGSRGSYRRYR